MHFLCCNSHHLLSEEKGREGREPLISAKQVERMSHQCRHRCIFHAASQILTIKSSDTKAHVWQVTRHLCFPPVTFFFLQDVFGCSILQFTALCLQHRHFYIATFLRTKFKKIKSKAVMNMSSKVLFFFFTWT